MTVTISSVPEPLTVSCDHGGANPAEYPIRLPPFPSIEIRLRYTKEITKILNPNVLVSLSAKDRETLWSMFRGGEPIHPGIYHVCPDAEVGDGSGDIRQGAPGVFKGSTRVGGRLILVSLADPGNVTWSMIELLHGVLKAIWDSTIWVQDLFRVDFSWCVEFLAKRDPSSVH